MAEEKICEILSKQKLNLPKLNSENVEKISKSLTDIIYDSFKTKLPSATEKRLTVLKYLRSLNCNSEHHLAITQSNHEIFLNSIQKVYKNCTEPQDNYQVFLKRIQSDLNEHNPDNLYNEITKFCARKSRSDETKRYQLEIIRKHDQEQLNSTYKIYKPLFSSDPAPLFLESLFEDSIDAAAENRFETTESPLFRHKQIKYAYALLHFKQWLHFKPLLSKLAEYSELSTEEKDFLVYFTCKLDLENEKELASIILDKFGFVFELIVIRICTRLVQGAADDLGPEMEALRLFKHFDSDLGLRLTGMVHQLYAWSCCNSSILNLLLELS